MIGTPYLEIDTSKLFENAKKLVDMFGSRGIGIIGVTKIVLGEPIIARLLVAAGVSSIGDSRIANIVRMREAKIDADLILIRTPFVREAHDVVKYADVSFNTEMSVIVELSSAAIKQNKVHDIVLMVEMGDLREGVLRQDLDKMIEQVLRLKGVKLLGLGTNLACFNGVKPSKKKMEEFSFLAGACEKKFNIKLQMVSGGNSANIDWMSANENVGQINNIRLGESIFIGRETLLRRHIKGLHLDAFILVVEVIESKIKPSLPDGEVGQDAFGNIPVVVNKGEMLRSILGLGKQDVFVPGLTPLMDVDILGSSSDHLILDATRAPLCVGDQVRFSLDYAALLSSMTSPFVGKVFINTEI